MSGQGKFARSRLDVVTRASGGCVHPGQNRQETKLVREFQFITKLDLTTLLGIKARNVAELLKYLQRVPDASVYYHTHRFLQQHHYLSPEPPNDFAYWIGEVLNDAVLAESISSVDIIRFHSIHDLRAAFITLIQKYIEAADTIHDCPKGEEFHFMASQTFAIRTPYRASTLREFREHLEKVTINSLYYHIFDARMRLQQDENDFSSWFREIGKVELADEIRRLDPYTYTLEGLRKRLLVMARKHDND